MLSPKPAFRILFLFLAGIAITPLTAADNLEEYTGIYQLSDNSQLTLRQAGTKLVGAMANRPLFHLKKVQQDRFQVIDLPVTLIFLRNRSGHIYALEIRQPLSDIIAPRLGKGANSSAEKPKLQLTEAQLKRCVGRYVVGGLYIVLIRFENGGLTYQPLGPNRYNLIPKSESLFQVEGKPEQIEFELAGNEPAQKLFIITDSGKRLLIRMSL